MKLSVVIIAYKVEGYLRQCIESVIQQQYRDLEIILVDDGSPDECPEICDEYAGKDSRVRVIHQSNQGSFMARWNGLLSATGVYVSFVDGDDWLDPDMYDRMMDAAKAQNADIVVSGYREDFTDTSVCKMNIIKTGLYKESRLDEIRRTTFYTGVFYQAGINAALWNKIIRRDLFFQNMDISKHDIRMGDDAALTYPVITRAKSIMVMNEFFPYHYRRLPGSLSTGYDERYFDRAEQLIDGLKKNLGMNPEMLDALNYYTFFILKIGVHSILSSGYSLTEKISVIERESDRLMKLIDVSAIDWHGFSREDQQEINRLANGQAKRMVIEYYSGKVQRKVLSVFRKLSAT